MNDHTINYRKVEKRIGPNTLRYKFFKFIWLHSRKNLRLRRWAKTQCFKELYSGKGKLNGLR